MTERTLMGPGGATEAKQAELDIFGSMLVGQLNNKVEVHFDDTNWATYVTTTRSGGAPVPAQANGRLQFSTGTGVNGLVSVESLDVVKYRPKAQAYGAGTVAFITPPTTAGQKALIGHGGATDGVFVGYVGSAFGIVHRRASVDAFVAQSAWNIDKMDGTGVSGLTIDPAKGFIWEWREGLFGYAGAVLCIVSPYPWKWKPVHYVPWYQAQAEPFFTNYDFPIRLELTKGGAGANDIVVNTACWGGGTTSQMSRISDPISDRSLAIDTRSVLWGKTPSGGYVPVGVNNQGRLQVTNDSVGTTGAAAPTSGTLIGGSDGTNLRALKVAADGTAAVDDNASEFWRILNKRYADTEEVRYDIPAVLVNASIYTGVAPEDTLTSAASWTVIRAYFDSNGQPSRHRIRFGVEWDNRALGWT